MFMVTKKEEQAIMGVEGVYCCIQTAIGKIIDTLQYNRLTASKSSSLLKKFFKRDRTQPAERELYELLEALIFLKSVFESNMPIVVEGKLFFRFKNIDKEGSFVLQTGTAQGRDDLIFYFEDLEEKLTNALALPEVLHAVNSSLFAHYSPSLVRANLGITSYHQQYLKDLQSEEENASKIGRSGLPRGTSKKEKTSHKK